jgi:exopolysaccharide biosynthesis polyprenyl glycosylphosphotransferase
VLFRSLDAARAARSRGRDVYLVPEPPALLAGLTASRDHVRGFPVVRVPHEPCRRASWRLKRALDVVLAAVGLAACAPLLAACAIASRREGGRGVLFRQARVGLRLRCFDLLKLRTLKPASEQESATLWSIADDRRVGPVGRFLRRTSIDELPQLWNVLRGEMSLVGPRPERPYFVERFAGDVPAYQERHRVPPGITGWAQIHGLRGDTSIEDRVRCDNHYIDTWSLWRDITIILRTAGAPLQRGGSR